MRDKYVPINQPITIEDISQEKILALTKSDKNMDAAKIKFVLLKKVGKAFVDRTVTDEEILEAVREIYFSDEDMRE